MADVLLARTDGIEGFERHVVLKRIRAEYARDPHFIKMFLDEARVAANLHHQHIVQVNDIGEANGNFFFAMEYLHGEDVRALLTAAAKARMHIPLGVVVAIGSAAAAGLHYAHERRANDKRPLNIVHCDVSPSNILVGYDGSIKVVDFGIAKAALRTDDARYLKGKASYMSPEQCAGGTIDRRSDVFCLGIVLYELATTTRLFKGPSDAHVMDAVMKGRAPLPRVRRPDLPNELSMIIMRALDTDPARRYQTAEELRAALDRFAVGAGLNTSEAAVASVLKKMFGERPEPWLDLPAGDAEDPRSSWVEMPQMDSGRARRPSDLAAGTDRFGPVTARPTMAPVPVEPPRAMSEPQLPVAAAAPRKAPVKRLAIGAAALAAVGAAAVALVVSGGDPEGAPAMTAASMAAASAPAAASMAAAP
ncbi:MAG TPA: serine/threonine-protein kinase, partial [Kofleriaceae bacterium]|nr:serine/threonine-protein kinase [Kofleriaceae bacterium]